MRKHGFTLIELVILLTVMSILAVSMIVRMPSVDLYQAYNFSNVLLYDLNLTKVLSMSQNQRYRIVIGASSYQIQDQNGVPVMHPETTSSVINYPTGVSVTPAITLIFDSLGQPYDVTNTALSTTSTITVSSSVTSQVLSIIPQTGFIQ